MAQKRTSTCPHCRKRETALVRYIISTHYKSTKYKHYDYEKQATSQTIMFVCTNGECWRHFEIARLAPEWGVKEWKKLPQRKLIVTDVKVEIPITTNGFIQTVQVEQEDRETRRFDVARQEAQNLPAYAIPAYAVGICAENG